MRTPRKGKAKVARLGDIYPPSVTLTIAEQEGPKTSAVQRGREIWDCNK